MITRQQGFPPTYPSVPPAGQWMGRSGKASWYPPSGPAYGVARWSPCTFRLPPAKLMMDPSDPQTWQRPYVFTA
jgi:hypothetical protein